MSDFQNFRNLIGDSFYNELKEIIEKSSETIEYPVTRDNVSKLLTAASGVSINTTLAILENYHLWVEQQKITKQTL